jgi:hypothetical protein
MAVPALFIYFGICVCIYLMASHQQLCAIMMPLLLQPAMVPDDNVYPEYPEGVVCIGIY